MIGLKFARDPQVITEKFRALPGRVRVGLERAINESTARLELRIKEKVSGEVLNIRSGNLNRGIKAVQAQSSGSNVTGRVAAENRVSKYGLVHEMGGTFNVPEHSSVSKKGNPFIVRSHTATYPERSFMRSTLREQAPDIRTRMQTAMNEAIK